MSAIRLLLLVLLACGRRPADEVALEAPADVVTGHTNGTVPRATAIRVQLTRVADPGSPMGFNVEGTRSARG